MLRAKVTYGCCQECGKDNCPMYEMPPALPPEQVSRAARRRPSQENTDCDYCGCPRSSHVVKTDVPNEGGGNPEAVLSKDKYGSLLGLQSPQGPKRSSQRRASVTGRVKGGKSPTHGTRKGRRASVSTTPPKKAAALDFGVIDFLAMRNKQAKMIQQHEQPNAAGGDSGERVMTREEIRKERNAKRHRVSVLESVQKTSSERERELLVIRKKEREVEVMRGLDAVSEEHWKRRRFTRAGMDFSQISNFKQPVGSPKSAKDVRQLAMTSTNAGRMRSRRSSIASIPSMGGLLPGLTEKVEPPPGAKSAPFGGLRSSSKVAPLEAASSGASKDDAPDPPPRMRQRRGSTSSLDEGALLRSQLLLLGAEEAAKRSSFGNRSPAVKSTKTTEDISPSRNSPSILSEETLKALPQLPGSIGSVGSAGGDTQTDQKEKEGEEKQEPDRKGSKQRGAARTQSLTGVRGDGQKTVAGTSSFEAFERFKREVERPTVAVVGTSMDEAQQLSSELNNMCSMVVPKSTPRLKEIGRSPTSMRRLTERLKIPLSSFSPKNATRSIGRRNTRMTMAMRRRAETRIQKAAQGIVTGNTEAAEDDSAPLTRKGSWKVTGRTEEEEMQQLLDAGDIEDEDAAQSMRRRLRDSCIILPDSRLRISWDLLIMSLVMYNAVKVPMDVAFLDGEDPLQAFETATTVLFWVDMGLNFFTGFRSAEGKLVLDLRRIVPNYLKTWFALDFVSSFPVDQFAQGDDDSFAGANKLIRLVRIVKLLRVLRMARIVKRLQKVMTIRSNQIVLFVIFLILFMLWHWFACLYWFISTLEKLGVNNTYIRTHQSINNTVENRWVAPAELQIWAYDIYDERCLDEMKQKDMCREWWMDGYQYGISFFWAVMTTIGAGAGRDLEPNAMTEHIFSIFIVFSSIIISAFLIGSITQVLTNTDSQQVRHLKKIERVRSYLRARSVPRQVQQRIVNYYNWMYTWTNDSINSDMGGTFEQLHGSLKLELQVCRDQALISNSALFLRVSDKECVIELVEALEQQYSLPGEVVSGHREDMRDSMAILRRGNVRLCRVSGKNSWSLSQVDGRPDLKHLGDRSEGFTFGEEHLFAKEDEPQDSSQRILVQADQYCDLAVLSRDAFQMVMSHYPQMFLFVNYTYRQMKMQGWSKVRQMLRFAMVLKAFGSKRIDYHNMLLGRPSVRDPNHTETFMNAWKTQSSSLLFSTGLVKSFSTRRRSLPKNADGGGTMMPQAHRVMVKKRLRRLHGESARQISFRPTTRNSPPVGEASIGSLGSVETFDLRRSPNDSEGESPISMSGKKSSGILRVPSFANVESESSLPRVPSLAEMRNKNEARQKQRGQSSFTSSPSGQDKKMDRRTLIIKGSQRKQSRMQAGSARSRARANSQISSFGLSANVTVGVDKTVEGIMAPDKKASFGKGRSWKNILRTSGASELSDSATLTPEEELSGDAAGIFAPIQVDPHLVDEKKGD